MTGAPTLDDPRLTAMGLLAETYKGLWSVLSPQIKEHGLNETEFEVLVRLLRSEGSRLRMSGAKMKAGQVGAAMKASAKVVLKQKSLLEAGITGVTADFKLSMEIQDSTVKAGHTAVAASWPA